MFNVHATTKWYRRSDSRPAETTKSVDLDVSNANIASSTASLLMRYGANYVVFGEAEHPLLWLHCDAALRASY